MGKRMIDKGLKLPNLLMARYATGLTQDELAEKSNVSRSAITNLEKGEAGAFSTTAKKLADALGFEVWQLASRDGSDLQKKGGVG